MIEKRGFCTIDVCGILGVWERGSRANGVTRSEWR